MDSSRSICENLSIHAPYENLVTRLFSDEQLSRFRQNYHQAVADTKHHCQMAFRARGDYSKKLRPNFDKKTNSTNFRVSINFDVNIL